MTDHQNIERYSRYFVFPRGKQWHEQRRQPATDPRRNSPLLAHVYNQLNSIVLPDATKSPRFFYQYFYRCYCAVLSMDEEPMLIEPWMQPLLNPANQAQCFLSMFLSIDRGSWGNDEGGAVPKIATVQKPCNILAWSREYSMLLHAPCFLLHDISYLPAAFEALVKTINACLPQNKSKSFLSTRRARTFHWYILNYLLMREKLNYSLSMDEVY